jgi:hypothetical protein
VELRVCVCLYEAVVVQPEVASHESLHLVPVDGIRRQHGDVQILSNSLYLSLPVRPKPLT